ncbi:cytochrome P450 [Gymnopus androsaceus JB14]|uniref:Cytochrome P450 n=1 Tax=Gymnopus androsaceus JB14 TaxID=1447944 RepID=A0A6A4IKX8_9AGAR|nr:cytochrome P450 [Gymnopus androsaceus JB14]
MLGTVVKAIFAFIFISSAYILFGFVYRYYQRSLKFLRGPPRSSLLTGNDYEIIHQEEVNVIENKWFNEYGTAFRTSTCYGEDALMVADPRALQYVLHTSGYRFPKSIDSQQITKMMFGRGILWAEGEVHNRQRKALNPAFSATQLRQFLSLFQRSTARLANKWKEEQLVSSVVNVSQWLPKITLDVIGESAFDYKFGALDGHANELGEIFKHMFYILTPQCRFPSLPPNTDYTLPSLPAVLPTPLANFLCRFPTKEETRFREFSDASKKVAKSVFRTATEAANGQEDSKGSKDVLSVLLRSNLTEDPKKALDEDEGSTRTIMLAGHETTASTTTWLLFELAKSPKDQQRVYAEIRDVRARIGVEAELAVSDYDSMPFFNAVIKEALRLHPIVPTLARQAASDDSIPLDFPIITESGEEISQIPVSKGQRIVLSIAMYNRLTQVWGDDANEWKPERFIIDSKKKTALGVYANLMSFSAGVRACIGWRFAIMELQAILFGLLEKFEFSPPPGGLDDIQRVPAGIMIPMKKNNWQEGVQMPLHVKARE